MNVSESIDLKNILVNSLINVTNLDNPKDYADNQDARKFDSRLRGPVDPVNPLSLTHIV